jgi:hypothetical protein
MPVYGCRKQCTLLCILALLAHDQAANGSVAKYLKQVELPQNRYFLFMRELTAVELTPSLYRIAR